MFWSIFLQSFFLILAIVIIGRLIAGIFGSRADRKSDGSD